VYNKTQYKTEMGCKNYIYVSFQQANFTARAEDSCHNVHSSQRKTSIVNNHPLLRDVPQRNSCEK